MIILAKDFTGVRYTINESLSEYAYYLLGSKLNIIVWDIRKYLSTSYLDFQHIGSLISSGNKIFYAFIGNNYFEPRKQIEGLAKSLLFNNDGSRKKPKLDGLRSVEKRIKTYKPKTINGELTEHIASEIFKNATSQLFDYSKIRDKEFIGFINFMPYSWPSSIYNIAELHIITKNDYNKTLCNQACISHPNYREFIDDGAKLARVDRAYSFCKWCLEKLTKNSNYSYDSYLKKFNIEYNLGKKVLELFPFNKEATPEESFFAYVNKVKNQLLDIDLKTDLKDQNIEQNLILDLDEGELI